MPPSISACQVSPRMGLKGFFQDSNPLWDPGGVWQQGELGGGVWRGGGGRGSNHK
jgi:hypothetical protein